MAIDIQKVSTASDRKKFIQFQLDLYKDNPYFVPPIIADELESLDSAKNPVFQHAEATLFLAYKNRRIVGRIAAIVNWAEVKDQGKPKMRFGWYDVEDDPMISEALLAEVEKMAIQYQLKQIEGPVGFSNLDKAGLLIKGFDRRATLVTLYNHPYYASHLEQLGFSKNYDWVEYYIDVPKKGTPEKLAKFSNLISQKYNLKSVKFSSKSELKSLVDPMFELLDATYSILPSYVPITRDQIDYYRKKYINFINPSYVSIIQDENDKMIAFAITMPSYAKALQKAKGKLFPWDWFHLLKASRKNDTVEFYLIGVKPEYQQKGITAILFHEMLKTFIEHNIKYVETNPELEENKNVQALWSTYNPLQHKTRRSYIKFIS